MRSEIDSHGGPGRTAVDAGQNVARAGTYPADGPADPDRCRARLEEMWRHTVDLIVLLSMAYHDATSPPGEGEGDGLAASAEPVAGQDPDPALLSRLLAAHATLAEIEEALDRLKAGGYGICERCAQPMPAAWLAESPQVRCCPGCALEQLRWQPRSERPGAAGSTAGRLRLTTAG